MSDLVLLFTEWFLIGFTGAVVPGSVLVMIINVASNQGWRSAESAIVGHAILEIGFVILLTLGLSPILLLPEVQFWLPLLGGGVLLTLGSMAVIEHIAKFRDPQNTQETIASESQTPSINNRNPPSAPQKKTVSFGLGIATSIANPYFIIWWATVGATFITRFLPYFPAVPFAILPTAIIISVTHSSTDFIWYTIVIIGIVKGRHFIGARYYSILIIVSGIIMAYLGITYLLGPISTLFLGGL